MKDFYDDHSGDDEVRPSDTRPAEDVPMMPDPSGPMYHDPTQPVEPIYPVVPPEQVEEVHDTENVDSDESFLDKVKRWFREPPDEVKKALDDDR